MGCLYVKNKDKFRIEDEFKVCLQNLWCTLECIFYTINLLSSNFKK